MTKQQQQATAKIYQFPARPRATSDSQQRTAKSFVSSDASQPPAVEFGRGWYHEAAIEEADGARKVRYQR